MPLSLQGENPGSVVWSYDRAGRELIVQIPEIPVHCEIRVEFAEPEYAASEKEAQESAADEAAGKRGRRGRCADGTGDIRPAEPCADAPRGKEQYLERRKGKGQGGAAGSGLHGSEAGPSGSADGADAAAVTSVKSLGLMFSRRSGKSGADAGAADMPGDQVQMPELQMYRKIRYRCRSCGRAGKSDVDKRKENGILIKAVEIEQTRRREE